MRLDAKAACVTISIRVCEGIPIYQKDLELAQLWGLFVARYACYKFEEYSVRINIL